MFPQYLTSLTGLLITGGTNNLFCSIYDLAFKPDGSQLIIAAGLRVLVRLFHVRLPKTDIYILSYYII